MKFVASLQAAGICRELKTLFICWSSWAKRTQWFHSLKVWFNGLFSPLMKESPPIKELLILAVNQDKWIKVFIHLSLLSFLLFDLVENTSAFTTVCCKSRLWCVQDERRQSSRHLCFMNLLRGSKRFIMLLTNLPCRRAHLSSPVILLPAHYHADLLKPKPCLQQPFWQRFELKIVLPPGWAAHVGVAGAWLSIRMLVTVEDELC